MTDLAALGWEVHRVAPALGAHVAGVDLTRPVSSTEARGLVELLSEHLVLTFHDQSLDPARQVELGRIFGDPYVHPFLEAVPEHPSVLLVAKEPDEAETFGGEHWHADITFVDPPSSVSLLHAHELPPLGGDTLFANQFLAFDQLSDGMQRMLALSWSKARNWLANSV